MLGTTAPAESVLGLYVHVPFCALRCHFCSFTTAPFREGAMARYLAALHREIDLVATAPWTPDVRLETVFLGGGTPSLLEAGELADVLGHLRGTFTIAPEAEITVECNPESVDALKLADYRRAGVTRVSLGVQSLDDAILPRLNRRHDGASAKRAFDAARAAGIASVSIDLMYGLPGLDVAGWARAVDAVIDWRPDHLSAYGMTLEGGSRWGSEGAPTVPTEDTVVEQYWVFARAAALRDLELCPARLPLPSQRAVLAPSRVPGPRARRVRVRRRRPVRQREIGRPLWRAPRARHAAGRRARAADTAPASG